MKKGNSKEIKINISEINETSYKQTHSPIPIEEIVFGENLVFRLGFSFNVDIEKELFKSSTTIRFLVNGFEEPVIELEIEIIFHVQNINNVVINKEQDGVDIDDNFLTTIAGVCIGTARGILSKNTKGTPFSKFPLPLLNPNDIIKNMRSE